MVVFLCHELIHLLTNSHLVTFFPSDEHYHEKNYWLAFSNNYYQANSWRWIGHLVLPLHVYFLFRLMHYRQDGDDQAVASLSATVQQQCPCPAKVASCQWLQHEHWANYFTKHNHCIRGCRNEIAVEFEEMVHDPEWQEVGQLSQTNATYTSAHFPSGSLTLHYTH